MLSDETGDQSDISKKFAEELNSKPEFKEYLSLEDQKHMLNQEQYLKTLGELTNYFHFQILAMPPHMESFSSQLLTIVSHDNLVIHQLLFVEKEIYDLSCEIHKSNADNFNSFLEFLASLVTKYTIFPITINSKKIIADFQSDPWNLKALRAHRKTLFDSSTHQRKRLVPSSKLFQKIVSFLAPKIPGKSLNFPIHCYQNIFDATVSQNDFIFYFEIQSLVNSLDKFEPNEYINELLEICDRFTQFYELKQKSSRKVIFILLIRFVFDEVYPMNHYFQNEVFDIITPLSKFTFLKLQLPLDYFPPDTKPRNTPRKILREDKHWVQAINALEEAQFHTNPVDILNCFYRSILAIQHAANFYSHSKIDIGSIELIFKLFVAVALASDIPELKNLSHFANDFILDGSLSEELLYTRAILIASTNYMIDLCEKEKRKYDC
ncbi:hypothetical protein TRFO_10829 [Tritrichomonas foetus]|uniref:VPS9 domain-containing protein n=1 Tax=Tritrichomonas foetus TaxID=1144522 RepID=A0A1J4J876_9EUKA|nr:hypothetical protein TRFO_10829 [Tritrichomonas foetus]|eukprot:OHS94889.1 hypothetical protein TRFO_10829 [Tritrichomonas foetus]